jgi:hypothetical protein
MQTPNTNVTPSRARARKRPTLTEATRPVRHRYTDMLHRCYDAMAVKYPIYGGRGIEVAPEWHGLAGWDAFCAWAQASGYAPHLTIERIDCNGPYSPDNCTWITREQQARNRRTNHYLEAWNERKPICAWAEDPRCRASAGAIASRIRRGWSPAKAITTPAKSTRGGN